jgi:hypothetical protein
MDDPEQRRVVLRAGHRRRREPDEKESSYLAGDGRTTRKSAKRVGGPVAHDEADMTLRWYLWFGVAALLFAIGVGALVVLGDGKTATGEDDTGLVNGLAWLSWLLSWFGALASAGYGIVLGSRRVRDR